MKRSHLVSPPGLSVLSGHVCHGVLPEKSDNIQLSPAKLTQPQKRRRRAAWCAIRDALIYSSELKSSLGLVSQIDDGATQAQHFEPVPYRAHARLSNIEHKLDQVLVALGAQSLVVGLPDLGGVSFNPAGLQQILCMLSLIIMSIP